MHRILLRAGALALALAIIGAGVLVVLARTSHDDTVTALARASRDKAVTAPAAPAGPAVTCQIGPDDSSLNVTFTASDGAKACADTITGRAKGGEYWRPKQPVDYAMICDLMNDSGAAVTVRGNLDADYEGRKICAAVLADGGFHDVTGAGAE
jgi:hypothetical protein